MFLPPIVKFPRLVTLVNPLSPSPSSSLSPLYPPFRSVVSFPVRLSPPPSFLLFLSLGGARSFLGTAPFLSSGVTAPTDSGWSLAGTLVHSGGQRSDDDRVDAKTPEPASQLAPRWQPTASVVCAGAAILYSFSSMTVVHELSRISWLRVLTSLPFSLWGCRVLGILAKGRPRPISFLLSLIFLFSTCKSRSTILLFSRAERKLRKSSACSGCFLASNRTGVENLTLKRLLDDTDETFLHGSCVFLIAPHISHGRRRRRRLGANKETKKEKKREGRVKIMRIGWHGNRKRRRWDFSCRSAIVSTRAYFREYRYIVPLSRFRHTADGQNLCNAQHVEERFY